MLDCVEFTNSYILLINIISFKLPLINFVCFILRHSVHYFEDIEMMSQLSLVKIQRECLLLISSIQDLTGLKTLLTWLKNSVG